MSTKIKFDARSIKFRLWVYFAAIGIGIVALVWLLQLFFLDHYYEEMKIKEVSRVAASISHAYQRGDENLPTTIRELSINNDFYVVLESDKGLVLFSPEKETTLPVYRYLGETSKLKEMLENSSETSVSFKVDTGVGEYRTLAYGCAVQSADVGRVFLYIFSPLYPVASTVSILRHQLFYVTVFALIFAFVMAIFFANRISRPVKAMTTTAAEMGKGNYDVKFEAKSFSEINDLADTLNTAAYELGMADSRQKDLIANVSHDLRTPLTMIRSYAEMIRDLSGDDPEKRNAHLQVIMDESDRLSQLVGDMATISAMQTHKTVLERAPFDFIAATASILSSFDILTEQEGFRFTLTSPRSAMVYGDESKIKQVIVNLVNNAVKYCGEDKQVQVNIRRVGKKYRLEVVDHGPGIAPDELPHVWDRYYRTSANYARATAGSGLGLSIVKEILTLHHANYGVSSKVGKGTTFWFELPYMRKERKEKDRDRAGKSIPQDPASIAAVEEE